MCKRNTKIQKTLIIWVLAPVSALGFINALHVFDFNVDPVAIEVFNILYSVSFYLWLSLFMFIVIC